MQGGSDGVHAYCVESLAHFLRILLLVAAQAHNLVRFSIVVAARQLVNGFVFFEESIIFLDTYSAQSDTVCDRVIVGLCEFCPCKGTKIPVASGIDKGFGEDGFRGLVRSRATLNRH